MTFNPEDLETVKDAIRFAIHYCNNEIETTMDSWTERSLEQHKDKFEILLEQIQ